MQIESPVRARVAEPPSIGSEELAEGLMLVRASTLKIVRLQLAMERQDRRLALETVDDLVALDRRLQDYLADVPAGAEQMLFRGALDDERAMLNREKLALASGVVRREPAAPPAPDADADAVEPELISWDASDFTSVEEPGPHRAMLWFALVLAALAVVSGAAWMLVGPDALAQLAGQFGLVR
jgi:hypothetical protein